MPLHALVVDLLDQRRLRRTLQSALVDFVTLILNDYDHQGSTSRLPRDE